MSTSKWQKKELKPDFIKRIILMAKLFYDKQNRAKHSSKRNQNFNKTNDVTLSNKPTTWDDFLIALKDANVPSSFLSQQERALGHKNH